MTEQLSSSPQVSQPGMPPAEFFDMQNNPPTLETVQGLEIPTPEVEAMGETAIGHTEQAETGTEILQESSEATAETALWNAIATRTEQVNPYHKDTATVHRLPISLPMRNQSDYAEGAIQYVAGPDIKGVLEMYGTDPATIEDAEQHDWNIRAARLPQELKHTMLTANLYEAMSLSRDPAAKQRATERNTHITPENIWQPTTLHHVTTVKNLGEILKDGQLGVQMIAENDFVNVRGGAFGGGNLNFGRSVNELPVDATNEQKMDNLTYNRHGGGEVYIHYTRPEGCYREGEEYEGDGNVSLMSGGMPSTEISALTMRDPGNRNHNFDRVRDDVIENGFYVPIFEADGKLAYSKADFDADRKALEEGTYVTVVAREAEASKQQELEAIRQSVELQQQKAAEAAALSMTVEQYQEHLDKTRWDNTGPSIM